MAARPSSLLIGGTSHLGKTSIAKHIATALGWRCLSTDAMGRHPGRPWPDVLPRNQAFFMNLSDAHIYEFLEIHHQNIWPVLSRQMADQTRGYVMEGCALRPRFIKDHAGPSVFFHAPADVITARIKRNAGYDGLAEDHQRVVDRFITRSLRDNDVQLDEARAHDIFCLDVSKPEAARQFAAGFIARC